MADVVKAVTLTTVKLGLLAAWTLLLACKSSNPPPAPTTTAAQVAAELIDAGCIAPGPDVTSAISAEQATGHDPWLGCMFDGGTVAGCGAPCAKQ